MAALLRTQAAIDQIRIFRQSEHFDPFRDALIETLCIRSITVMCIAEIEEKVAKAVESRISVAVDEKAAAFISGNLASIIRRTAKSDIAKTVRMFGNESKERFNATISDSEVTAYENLLAGRHDTAHAEGGNLSIDELVIGVASAEKILEKLVHCIA